MIRAGVSAKTGKRWARLLSAREMRVGILGVDMNRTHVRVWTTGGCSDFELPRGRRPGFWTVLRYAVPPRRPSRGTK